MGLRAIKRGDGDKTYVLSSQGLMVFDAKDHKLLTIGSPAADVSASKTTRTRSPPGQVSRKISTSMPQAKFMSLTAPPI